MDKFSSKLLVAATFLSLSLLVLDSCGEKSVTPIDTKYIGDFHTATSQAYSDMIEEDSLALYVDYSTCIAEGMKNSPFYIKLVPSFVDAAKTYYSIKGDCIKKEVPADTYNRLLNISEVNYADLKTAAEQMADGKTEAVLLTDGEYYNPTMAGANPNNPYLAKAFKKWMLKGHDIFIISEPYAETCNGRQYNKKRFYFLFTDTRLKNNIYQRIIETASLEQFPYVRIFHLSAGHPNIKAEGNSSKANGLLAASIESHGNFEIQDWTVDWKSIEKYIMGAVDNKTGESLPNGDCVISGLKVDRNSFGGYKITDVDIKVYDLNAAYTDYYIRKEAGEKSVTVSDELPVCPDFMLVDHKEFERHSNMNLYFDIMNLNNSFLKYGKPYNYFRIDFFITKTQNVFSKYSPMFTFDLLGQPGKTNSSVVTSVEQCLTDHDLADRMKRSPFYTIYVKSNKY